MKTRMFISAAVIAASAAIAALDTAAAQGVSRMPGGMDQQQPADHGMMQGGMGRDIMCPMMRSGMMQGGMMGSGMMGSGTMRSGMDALFGSRVMPVMNLSVDDVRGYLASQLERLNNKRLKVGNINSGDGTITAEIVTVDNSLVQRLKVDRHSGAITYEN
jgi:hypothetical protein